jgi:hypothetical protein
MRTNLPWCGGGDHWTSFSVSAACSAKLFLWHYLAKTLRGFFLQSVVVALLFITACLLFLLFPRGLGVKQLPEAVPYPEKAAGLPQPAAASSCEERACSGRVFREPILIPLEKGHGQGQDAEEIGIAALTTLALEQSTEGSVLTEQLPLQVRFGSSRPASFQTGAPVRIYSLLGGGLVRDYVLRDPDPHQAESGRRQVGFIQVVAHVRRDLADEEADRFLKYG